MRKRALVWIALLLPAAVVAGACVWPTAPGVTLASACRLRAGMTMGQVQVILGAPPSGHCAASEDPHESIDYFWTGHDAMVRIGFHGSGYTLSSASFVRREKERFISLPMIPSEPTYDSLHHWFLATTSSLQDWLRPVPAE